MIFFLLTLEYISAVVGTIFYKKLASKYTAYLLFFLWYVCLSETTSLFLIKYSYSQTWVYVIYTFFEFNVVLSMYHSITKTVVVKKFILFFIIVFNLVYFTEVFLSGFRVNPSISTVFGSVLISIFLILYLKEFLYSDKILNYTRSFYFWVTIGLLVYYLGSIPFQSVLNFLKNRNLYFVQISLAIFSQLCVIIGFIWSETETK